MAKKLPKVSKKDAQAYRMDSAFYNFFEANFHMFEDVTTSDAKFIFKMGYLKGQEDEAKILGNFFAKELS